MALLIPLGLIAGLFLIAVFWEAVDEEHRGAAFGVFLFAAMIFGPLGCVLYGVYGWLRYGGWASLAVGDFLPRLIREGVDLSWAFSTVGWAGVDKLSDDYLDLNIGFTLFVAPIPALLYLFRDKAK